MSSVSVNDALPLALALHESKVQEAINADLSHYRRNQSNARQRLAICIFVLDLEAVDGASLLCV